MAKELDPNKVDEASAYLYESVNGQSPLACVLIMAAFLESAVQALLKQYLLDDPESINLYAGDRSLSSGSKCQQMAYCLGLISGTMYKNMTTISKIRNDMAHGITRIDFDDPSIKSRCLNLAFPPDIGEAKIKPDGTFNLPPMTTLNVKLQDDEELSPRERFIEIGLLLFQTVLGIAKRTVHRECNEKWQMLTLPKMEGRITEIRIQQTTQEGDPLGSQQLHEQKQPFPVHLLVKKQLQATSGQATIFQDQVTTPPPQTISSVPQDALNETAN